MPPYDEPQMPDLTQFFRSLRENGRSILLIGMGALLVLLTMNAWFQVEADEEAVVLRLGVPTGAAHGPGLHGKIPIMDQVFKANVKKVHQLEFGFRTTRADIRSEFDESGYQNEALMLTGDLALVDVQWTVFYKIADTGEYLFQVRNVEETIRDVSEAVMRTLVGDRSNDEVMTKHRAEIAQKAEGVMQKDLDLCNSGIHIERVALRQVEPPEAAQNAFNKVNEARAKRQQMIEQAERGRVEAVELAKGVRNAKIAEARGHKEETVETARGEALRFVRFLEKYQLAPEITRRWLYFETMEKVLAKADRKVLLTDGGTGTVKLLPLTELTGASRRGGK